MKLAQFSGTGFFVNDLGELALVIKHGGKRICLFVNSCAEYMNWVDIDGLCRDYKRVISIDFAVSGWSGESKQINEWNSAGIYYSPSGSGILVFSSRRINGGNLIHRGFVNANYFKDLNSEGLAFSYYKVSSLDITCTHQ
jgi:hypothetical protein